MAILRRILITGIVLSACGAVYALYEFRGPLRDVGAYWTPSRLAYIDADRELESVLDLTAWIGGGTGISIANDGDGTLTVSGHVALTVVDSQSVNLTLSTQQLTADVNDKDYGDVVVSSTGSVWAVGDDSHAHTSTTISGLDISSDTNFGTAMAAIDLLVASGDGVDANTAAVANGDTKRLATGDQIYDFVIGLGYLDAATILDNLADVNATDPCDGYVLTWDDPNSQWIAAAGGGGGLTQADIDTFAELDAIVADKALVNKADGAVWLAVHDFGGATSFEIPNGPLPTLDAEGELAWESDDNDLHIYDGAANIVLTGTTKSRSFVIKGPSASDDFIFWQTPRRITITLVAAKCSGGTRVIGQLQEYNGTGGSPVDVDSSDWTITTTELEDIAFTNAVIDIGDWVGWKTTSVLGKVSFFSLTFEYYEQ